MKQLILMALCASLLTCAAAMSSANMYMRTNPDGSVSITDTPMDEGYEIVIRTRPDVIPWREYAKILAERHGVEVGLVRAVIWVESAENPLAVSHKGAQGLMQLMPETANDLGVDDPMSPRDNVRGGIKYLAKMLRRFDGNVRLALAAYNAGPGAVEKYGGIPPYPETERYVKKVMEIYEKTTLNEDNT